jgi:tRNA pseudouridine32 synthase/23S rRNA pseudouridine746 synthase
LLPLFDFKTNIKELLLPATLNNPFNAQIPAIAKIAAQEFQQYISFETATWAPPFGVKKGKMYGILVVQKPDRSLAYLGAISGKMPVNNGQPKFVPSIFNEAADDYFINKGMLVLGEMGKLIENCDDKLEIKRLKEIRKSKSLALQQQLFKNYEFLSIKGEKQNALDLFKGSPKGYPPSGAGECAAPKLLHFAFTHHLRPIAIAEFWWGKPAFNKERLEGVFYPACKPKCKPILEFMLNDENLFKEAKLSQNKP